MSLLHWLGSNALSLLPFTAALRAQTRIAKIAPLRRLAYRRQAEILDLFLSELGVRDADEIEEAHREQYLARWMNRAGARLAALPSSRRELWLKPPTGLEDALSRGAFFVGTHFGCGFLTPLALACAGVDVVAIVHAPNRTQRRPFLVRSLDLGRELPHRVVIEARSILLGGGVVFVAGDVVSGGRDGAIGVRVLGRRRQVARGFAELSISSSVSPTPIFSHVDSAGRVFTWIEPPLVAADGADHGARVAELAQAYADRLSAVFAKFPGGVPALTIQNHLVSSRDEGGGIRA